MSDALPWFLSWGFWSEPFFMACLAELWRDAAVLAAGRRRLRCGRAALLTRGLHLDGLATVRTASGGARTRRRSWPL
jgi:hypothetical protein